MDQSTSGRPSSGWRCLGVSERMRVPRPPARTIAASFMAGAGGFEPPVTGPKPAALPLGYAPPRGGRLGRPHGARLPLPQEHCEQHHGDDDKGDDRGELEELPEHRHHEGDELRRGEDPRDLAYRPRAEPLAD